MSVSVVQTGVGELIGSQMIVPVMTGLRLWNFAGYDLAKSRRNLAGAALAAATVTGAPTIAADRATVGYANHFSFPALEETQDLTLIMAIRCIAADMTPTGNRPVIGGWYVTGGSPVGVSIQPTGTTNLRATVPYLVSGAPATTNLNLAYTAGELNTARLIALRVEQGVGATFYDLTKNQAPATAATANLRSIATGRPLLIGAGSNSASAANMESLFTGLHSVALTKSQIDQQAVAIRKFLLEVRGVTV